MPQRITEFPHKLNSDGFTILDCAYSLLTTPGANPLYTDSSLKRILRDDEQLKEYFLILNSGLSLRRAPRVSFNDITAHLATMQAYHKPPKPKLRR